MKLPVCLFLGIITVVFFTGCQTQHGSETAMGYETLKDPPNRDTSLARAHNAAGLQHLNDGNFEGAEKELKDALAADMFFGPAHNNLGTLYFKQEKFYLAAWEFQYAVKLMPGQIEPLNNLGLVFEKVGRLNDAEQWYDKALSLKPESPEVIGNLARVQIRSHKKDEKTLELLSKIVMKDSRPEWISWAQQQLAFTREPDKESLMPQSDEIKTLSEDLK